MASSKGLTVHEAGRRGGRVRASRLSAARRREIASKAGKAGAKARWGKRKKR